MKKAIHSLMPRMLIAVLLFFAAQNLQAGPKVKRLQMNSRKIKEGTLLIPPVLPDSFVLAKLEKKGPEAVKLYLENIRLTNENLRESFKDLFNFCKVQFIGEEAGIKTWADYFAYLKTFNADSVYVLQFGNAAQYADGKAVRIRPYERDIWGIYKTDGKTRMLISSGMVKHAWKLTYTDMITGVLQRNLNHYYKQSMGRGREKRGR